MKSTNTDNKTAFEVSHILIDLGCIIFRPHQPFKYNTGIVSPVYTDNRLILSSPNDRNRIVDFLITKVKEAGIPQVIAGTSTAGIPHAAFIAQKLNLPMVYVRPETKAYGKRNQVEGSLKRGQNVVVIDDLISTGRSALEVVRSIRESGGNVTGIVAITTYGLKEADQNLTQNKTKLYTLTNLNQSCKIAAQKGFLKEDQIKVILDWAKNPKNWARKMGYE